MRPTTLPCLAHRNRQATTNRPTAFAGLHENKLIPQNKLIPRTRHVRQVPDEALECAGQTKSQANILLRTAWLVRVPRLISTERTTFPRETWLSETRQQRLRLTETAGYDGIIQPTLCRAACCLL
jgi:hypothetical protein